MRRFRFVGNSKEYRWDNPPIYDKVYDFNQFEKDYGFGADLEVFNELKNSEDFREVFQEPTKPLHKDTDLGYFAGLALTALLSNSNTSKQIQDQLGGVTAAIANQIVCRTAIAQAKELIKQLDEESK